jgi:hypothetical protein
MELDLLLFLQKKQNYHHIIKLKNEKVFYDTRSNILIYIISQLFNLILR